MPFPLFLSLHSFHFNNFYSTPCTHTHMSSAHCTKCKNYKTVACTIYSQNAHFFSIDKQVFSIYLHSLSLSSTHSFIHFISFMLQWIRTFEYEYESIFAKFRMSNAISKTRFFYYTHAFFIHDSVVFLFWIHFLSYVSNELRICGTSYVKRMPSIVFYFYFFFFQIIDVFYCLVSSSILSCDRNWCSRFIYCVCSFEKKNTRNVDIKLENEIDILTRYNYKDFNLFREKMLCLKSWLTRFSSPFI